MGINVISKVMRSGHPVCWLLLISIGLSSFLASATICAQGKQYWNSSQDNCIDCTVCSLLGKQLVVIRPCQVHQDTVCGPIDKLQLDLAKPIRPNHHRHHHGGTRHHEPKDAADGDRPMVWTFGDDAKPVRSQQGAYQLPVTTTEAPFTSAEALVWDWQAVALTFAVFACLLFFLVAAMYSYHQAKQWKRLKENFEADVEELSARLQLMISSGEFGDCLEPNAGPIYDVRKEKKIGSDGGNVYIDETNKNTMGRNA